MQNSLLHFILNLIALIFVLIALIFVLIVTIIFMYSKLYSQISLIILLSLVFSLNAEVVVNPTKI